MADTRYRYLNISLSKVKDNDISNFIDELAKDKHTGVAEVTREVIRFGMAEIDRLKKDGKYALPGGR